MKIIVFLAVALIISNISISQNILFLKTGDRLSGKLEGYNNDTIIFNLKGNKLKYSTSEVLSIYFDEKNAPLDLKQTTSTNGETKIFGVVTYYFNKNYGYKPDVGVEVYIVDSAKVPTFSMANIDTFYYASSYRDMCKVYQSAKKTVPTDILEELKKWNVETEEDFNSLDKRTYTNILSKIINSKVAITTFVDGGGNYSVKVEPGTYYVYMSSKNRTGLSITEIGGKIYCKKIIVKEGEDVNVSKQFEL